MSDLSPDDKAFLAEHLKGTIAADRFPLSPRVKRMRTILAKLEPPKAAPINFPAPKPPGEPSMVVARMRGAKRRQR